MQVLMSYCIQSICIVRIWMAKSGAGVSVWHTGCVDNSLNYASRINITKEARTFNRSPSREQ